MAELERRRWTSTVGGLGLSRRDRASCDYETYVPDPIAGREFLLAGDVAADVADAEVAIARLDAGATALVDSEALARILLRAEAVASSRIEGLEVGARRLLRHELAHLLPATDRGRSDITAGEVLANIEAMRLGVDAVAPGGSITRETLLGIHERLLADTQPAAHGGRLRDQQNWIGGSGYNPCAAAFVPPPPELVSGLIEDLIEFCNDDGLPTVAQAAIAHAQFETIHPFVDGNGRTGRALIHLVLRRRGLARRVLPPVSLVLATWADGYIDGLTGFRHLGRHTSQQAQEGLNAWVGRFAAACSRAVADASTFEERAASLEADWRQRLAPVRADSAVDRLLRILPGTPLMTVDGAARLIGRTFTPANDAIERLVAAGVLRQITVGRRNRAFEAPEVLTAFTALERRLASPAADTRHSPPARGVPR